MDDSNLSGDDQPGEMLERAVVGRFGFIREGTGGELTHLQVVADALAA